MAEQDKESGGSPPQSSAQDIWDILQGRATEEQRARFLKAVEDPFSETNEMLRGLSRRFRRRNTLAGRSSATDYSWERLDNLIAFVRQKREEGVFTYEETRTFIEPGAWAFESQDISSAAEKSKNNALATRILRAIEQTHPELAEELALFRSDRRR